MKLDRDDIIRLIEDCEADWDINHTRRMLRVASLISEGKRHDSEAIGDVDDWHSKWFASTLEQIHLGGIRREVALAWVAHDGPGRDEATGEFQRRSREFDQA